MSIPNADVATTASSAKELVSPPNTRQPETTEKVKNPEMAAQLRRLEEAVAKIVDPEVAKELRAQGERIIAAQCVADTRWKIIEYSVIGGAVVVVLCAVGYGGYRLYRQLTIS